MIIFDWHFDLETMTSVQILAFSADGKVRHNMQIISLPYHTGTMKKENPKLAAQWSNLSLSLSHISIMIVLMLLDRFVLTCRRHQHLPGVVLSHTASDQIWATDSGPACSCPAGLSDPGSELQNKDKR